MLLTALTFLPLLYALVVWTLPKSSWVRPVAFALSVGHFCLSLLLLKKFDVTTESLQMVERHTWVPQFGISYFVGLDGISLWLVLLSTFLVPLIILGSWKSIDTKIKGFHINMFVLLTTMIGTFVAMDGVLFYVFFEASLVPMYFIVGIWGGTRRIYATVKFFVYTMFGSVLMLVSLMTLMLMTQLQLGAMSASILDFYRLDIPFVGGSLMNPQTLMFVAFSLAFAIKVPMFPVHTWLPDAHVEAPTPGSVILAGVMLKMGTYGFMRFVLPLFPAAVDAYSGVFFLLGVVGILYGALVAMVQPDIKKLVAYSSVSHMGYVMVGLFALNTYGLTGGLYQMLNHGISTGALFLLVGMIYERTHSREIAKYGGLAMVMPLYTICFFIVTLSSIAVPGTNGFIGEFLILLGTFQAHNWYGAAAVLGVVLGAVYMLWMFKRVFFGEKGPLVSDEKHPLHDLSWREVAVLTPFIVLIFWMGIFPNHFLDKSKVSLEHLSKNFSNYQLTVQGENSGNTVGGL